MPIFPTGKMPVLREKHLLAANEDQVRLRNPKVVGDLAIIRAIVEREIRELARLERADLVAAIQAASGVNRRRGQAFRRRHLHLRRRQ